MLTKRGLFKQLYAETPSHLSMQALTHSGNGLGGSGAKDTERVAYITPGHLAAIKSAVIVPRKDDAHEPVMQLKEEERTTSRDAKRLVIGYGLKVRCGEIEDCKQLVVEGSLDALVRCEDLVISPKGQFNGRAEVEMAEISGQFNGELNVKKLLVIEPGAKVCGKVSYGQLRIAEGGELAGDVANSQLSTRKMVVSSIAKLRHLYG